MEEKLTCQIKIHKKSLFTEKCWGFDGCWRDTTAALVIIGFYFSVVAADVILGSKGDMIIKPEALTKFFKNCLLRLC